MSQSVIAPSEVGPYEFRGTIGEGAFSVVKLAYHKERNEFYACKIVPKSRLVHARLEARFEIEIRINQQLRHPGIVSLIDIFKDNFNFYIVMEFCPGGELFQWIVHHGHLTEEDSRPMIRQILEALAYVHSQNVSHRDLKPENVLISQTGHMKISDFGLSRFVGPDHLARTPCGSPCYASPECVSGRPYDGLKSDVWSVGVILYAMLTGKLPWTKRNQRQLFEQIRAGDYKIPDYVSENAQSLIRGLMTVDCDKRLTIEQAFEHPFLRDTGAQFCGMSPTMIEYISLKRVDMFFDTDNDEEVELKSAAEEARTKTEVEFGLEQTKRQILVKRLPRLRIAGADGEGGGLWSGRQPVRFGSVVVKCQKTKTGANTGRGIMDRFGSGTSIPVQRQRPTPALGKSALLMGIPGAFSNRRVIGRK